MGKPSKGTPADKRLKENQGGKGKPAPAKPFPGARPPFKAPKKGK